MRERLPSSRSEGLTERIVGRWLAQGGCRSERIVLAAKVSGDMGDARTTAGFRLATSGVRARRVSIGFSLITLTSTRCIVSIAIRPGRRSGRR